jgi:hypothetical protein
MKEQVLKDSSGRIMGKIRETTGGVLEIRDAAGRLKGKFDPRTNETRDSSGRLVGKGNLLATLL